MEKRGREVGMLGLYWEGGCFMGIGDVHGWREQRTNWIFIMMTLFRKLSNAAIRTLIISSFEGTRTIPPTPLSSPRFLSPPALIHPSIPRHEPKPRHRFLPRLMQTPSRHLSHKPHSPVTIRIPAAHHVRVWPYIHTSTYLGIL